MKTDINGTSTCPPGEERYETYWSYTSRKNLIQYDYRTPDGKLFSTIAKTLKQARLNRDRWLEMYANIAKHDPEAK